MLESNIIGEDKFVPVLNQVPRKKQCWGTQVMPYAVLSSVLDGMVSFTFQLLGPQEETQNPTV
jgi:hypothetical protein